MSTLSNVETGRGQAKPPGVRVAPETIPEAKSSQTGASVRYVPTPNKSWYMFRASYGREDRASDYIVEDGTFVYIAKRYVRKSVNGKQKRFWSHSFQIFFLYIPRRNKLIHTLNTHPVSLSYRSTWIISSTMRNITIHH